MVQKNRARRLALLCSLDRGTRLNISLAFWFWNLFYDCSHSQLQASEHWCRPGLDAIFNHRNECPKQVRNHLLWPVMYPFHPQWSRVPSLCRHRSADTDAARGRHALDWGRTRLNILPRNVNTLWPQTSHPPEKRVSTCLYRHLFFTLALSSRLFYARTDTLG